MPSWRMANTVCVASRTARPAHSEAIQNQLYDLGRAAVSMRAHPTPPLECRRGDAANHRLAAASGLVQRMLRRHTRTMNIKMIAIAALTLVCSIALSESTTIRGPVYTEDGRLTLP